MPETHDLRRAFVQYARVPSAAPVIQRGSTREIEGRFRVGPSIVVQLPFRRKARWFGIRLSWLSVQVKLPIGPKMEHSRHGIVLGWWKDQIEDEWQAITAAVTLGQHEWTVKDEREFHNPEFEGSNEDRGISVIGRRRVDAAGDAGADQ